MKKTLLTIIPLLLVSITQAQVLSSGYLTIPDRVANKGVKTQNKTALASQQLQIDGSNNQANSPKSIDEIVIGKTVYDMQTHATMPQRMVNHGNNSFSMIYMLDTDELGDVDSLTHGFQYSIPYSGSPQNTDFYYQGPGPTLIHVEDQRSAFGSLDVISGSDFVLSHNAIGTLLLSHNIFMGDTNFITEVTPITNTYWPQMKVGGSNGQTIHVLSLTPPSDTTLPKANFQGMDGALVYSRSLNAGQTWDKQKVLLPGIDSTHFKCFYPNSYGIDAKGNTIAFVAGGMGNDVILMKSVDNGNTWTKTVILPFPIAAFDDQITDIDSDNIADTLQTNDGSFTLFIDNNNKVHVFYGNMRIVNDDSTDGEFTYFPGTAGIMYWNENYDTNLPNLLAGVPDRDSNGLLDIGDDLFMYRLSLTSMPTVSTDGAGNIYLVYSSIADNTLLDIRSYRHLFMVRSTDNGQSWQGTYEVTYFDEFTEYVYPCMPKLLTDTVVHIMYQRDAEPGTAVWPLANNPHAYGENDIVYLDVVINETLDNGNPMFPDQLLTTEVIEHTAVGNVLLYPNPTSNFTQLSFNLTKAANINATLVNVMGQKVQNISSGNFGAGAHNVTIDLSGTPAGVYFVTLNTGNDVVTQKLVVR